MEFGYFNGTLEIFAKPLEHDILFFTIQVLFNHIISTGSECGKKGELDRSNKGGEKESDFCFVNLTSLPFLNQFLNLIEENELISHICGVQKYFSDLYKTFVDQISNIQNFQQLNRFQISIEIGLLQQE